MGSGPDWLEEFIGGVCALYGWYSGGEELA
jgi:hypothetical protein